jgi:hypothetical protein
VICTQKNTPPPIQVHHHQSRHTTTNPGTPPQHILKFKGGMKEEKEQMSIRITAVHFRRMLLQL